MVSLARSSLLAGDTMKKEHLEQLVSKGAFHTFRTTADGRVWLECTVCHKIPSRDGHAKDCLKDRFDRERKARGIT